VLFTNMVINPHDTSFEDAEIPLVGVGVNITPYVFILTMVNDMVVSKIFRKPRMTGCAQCEVFLPPGMSQGHQYMAS